MAENRGKTVIPGRNNEADSKVSSLKQKLKVLKKAYIQEQEEKATFKSQLEASHDKIIKLEEDLNEKEQSYLKTQKENQELHAKLMEARTTSKNGKQSLIIEHNELQDLEGFQLFEDYAPKTAKAGNSGDSDVLNVKVQQLEKQAKHWDEEREILEKELYTK